MNDLPLATSSAEVRPITERSNWEFAGLDLMRGIAALWVVAFHFPWSEQFRQLLPGLLPFTRAGWLGVPMFFVISGYCLAAAAARAEQKRETMGRFVFRRFRRIYPALWASIVLVIVMASLAPAVRSAVATLRGTPAATVAEAPLFANFTPTDWVAHATLIQVFREPTAPVNQKFNRLNTVYWTLAIEVQFYLLMAVGLPLRTSALTSSRSYRGWFLLAVTAAGVAAAVAVERVVAQSPAGENPLSPLGNTGLCFPFWPQFALGIVLFELRSRGLVISSRRLAAGGLTILTGVLLWWVRRGELNDNLFALGFCAWLYFLIPFDNSLRRATIPEFSRSRRIFQQILIPLRWVGEMSYSVYLVHFNLHKIPRLLLRQPDQAEHLFYDVLILLAVLGLCRGFYWAAESRYSRRA